MYYPSLTASACFPAIASRLSQPRPAASPFALGGCPRIRRGSRHEATLVQAPLSPVLRSLGEFMTEIG